MDALLQSLDSLLLYFFSASAFVCAALMLVLKTPMRVALALISTMISLGAIYGLLGVHFIAAFQVLIYVSAVMVFMVYVIMLLDLRDPTVAHRYSRLLVPGIVAAVVLLAVLMYAVSGDLGVVAGPASQATYGIQQFSAAFLNQYWLHFELTSVLLLAAVVAAIAVIKVNRRDHG